MLCCTYKDADNLSVTLNYTFFFSRKASSSWERNPSVRNLNLLETGVWKNPLILLGFFLCKEKKLRSHGYSQGLISRHNSQSLGIKGMKQWQGRSKIKSRKDFKNWKVFLDGRGMTSEGEIKFYLNKEQHDIKLPLSFQRAGTNRIPILLQNREKWSKLLQKWQARWGTESKLQAGLILLMDLLQESRDCFYFGNTGEEFRNFSMKIPNWRNFGMFILLFQAEKCAFFSGNSTWWMFHGITRPFGNSRSGIGSFHPQPVNYFTPLERSSKGKERKLFFIFTLWLKTQSSDCSILPAAPLQLFPIIPLFVHQG